MVQPVYVYRFPRGETVENPEFGPQRLEEAIKDAALRAGAKVDGIRDENGERTIEVRIPTSDVEFKYKLCSGLLPKPTERK